ncbi:MAG: hypothetical protein HKN36_05195 [Hellea sp.]|nr:hypothetical protein [Hellea sp.]
MSRFGSNGNISDSRIGGMTVGDYANGMPNIRISELIRSFGRQLRWVIPLFAIGAVPAWYMTKDIERTYEGRGTIMVTPGPMHTYQDITNPNAQGVLTTIESVSQAEVAIMKNDEVIDRVVGEMVSKFGESRFNKSAFEKINAARRSGDPVALANATVELHRTIENSFVVMPQAKSGVIHLVYKHPDGEIAVATLNAFIEQYLAFRRTLFVEGDVDVYLERSIATEEQLNEVEAKIQSFLRRNGVSDFDSERGGATTRTETLRAEINTIRSQQSETEAELASVEDQLRRTDPNIILYTDDMTGQRIVQAEIEMQQLLAKYLPNSIPVKNKQVEIDELKQLQAANGGGPSGRSRTGVNQTYQALLTRRNTLQSTADALREKEFTVQRLLNAVDAKVQKLQKIYPEYNTLLRESETLETRLKGYTDKYQAALVNQEQADASSENVHKIETPSLPRKGRNMSKILFALIMVGWGFTLFMIALLTVFLDPKLYSDPERRRRRRPAPSFDDFEDQNFGSENPIQQPSEPYVPEPVPIQPAAAKHYDPYAQHPPMQPAQAAAPPSLAAAYPAQSFSAVPYEAGGNTAYDVTATPYVPQQGTVHHPQGELPATEAD